MDDNDNKLRFYSDGKNVYDSNDCKFRLNDEQKAKLHEISGEEYRNSLNLTIPDSFPGMCAAKTSTK